MFCLISSTEVAITSQVLWTEVLMGWVEELTIGVIRRTAALLMMMIWTTKGRQGGKTVNIRAAIYTCLHDESVKCHSMVIKNQNIFPEFKVYFYPWSLLLLFYMWNYTDGCSWPRVMTKHGWPTLKTVPECILCRYTEAAALLTCCFQCEFWRKVLIF